MTDCKPKPTTLCTFKPKSRKTTALKCELLARDHFLSANGKKWELIRLADFHWNTCSWVSINFIYLITCKHVHVVPSTTNRWAGKLSELRPRRHVSFLFEKQIFVYLYALRPHVSDENVNRKRNFLKTLFSVECSENVVFEFPWWLWKPERFENDDVSIFYAAYLRKRNGRKWWYHVSLLHKAAMKYARMPKAHAKLLY